MAFIPYGHPEREENKARFLEGNHPALAGKNLVHATLNDFSRFDPSGRGDPEGDHGRGIYATDNPQDSNRNYATAEGPDQKSKIERLVERLEEQDVDMNEADMRKHAVKTLGMVHEGASMPVHMSIKNPVVLGGRTPTFFDFEHHYDEENDEYGEPKGELARLMPYFDQAAREFEWADIDDFKRRASEEAMDNGGISAEKLHSLAKQHIEASDEEGRVANSELWRTALELAGYDGIIDYTVSKKFSGMGVPEGTAHYVAFRPEQVKSAIGNQGTFDPNDPDITKAQGGEVEDNEAGELNFSPVPSFVPYHEDPEYQNWFGNSVTHREGVPVTYYTGTSKDVDFNKFNVGRHGAWFTANPSEASEYAKQNDSMGYKRDGWKMVPTNTASRVIPVHLKIENPYTGPLPEWVFADNYKKAQSDWFDTLRAKGHDGWIPEQYGGQLAVVLKEPHQIKSVNNRTWDPKNPRMDKAGGGEVEDEGIDALHSSPHDFDQFLMDKIGTGEGNQVYGHGLYFAENPNVSGQGGQYWNQFFNKMKSGPEMSAASAMRANKFDRDKALQHLQSSVDFHTKRAAPGSYGEGAEIEEGHRLLADEYRQAAEMLQRGDIAGPRTYEVRINAHPDHFLDWDKPLSEQSQHVQDILNSHPKAARLLGNDVVKGELSEPTGQSILNRLFGSPSEKSEHLRNLGIKGIRYLDAGSRGAGEGSRNYVVFDDKLVNVKRKYADGGVVKESSDGKEAREDRAARGNAGSGGNPRPGKPRSASRLSISDRSPIVERALMVVSRKA